MRTIWRSFTPHRVVWGATSPRRRPWPSRTFASGCRPPELRIMPSGGPRGQHERTLRAWSESAGLGLGARGPKRGLRMVGRTEVHGQGNLGRFFMALEPVDEPVPSVPPNARRLITILIAVGCATLIWGGWALSRSEERECPSSNFTYTDVSGLWLPWLVMVVLASCGVWVRRRLAPHVPKIKRATRFGVVAAVLTFPGWVAVMGVMYCAL